MSAVMEAGTGMGAALWREARLLRGLRDVWLVWLVAAGLSVLGVLLGLAEVAQQRATLDELERQVRAGRVAAVAEHSGDFGGVAYYSFHLTADPPSSLAFAALGDRDVHPWKHLVRMLALEGQIYENDAPNAELAMNGHFDFAFVACVLAPLLVVVLLHDLRAGERVAGRHDLLLSTARAPSWLWWQRATLRVGGLALALLLPLLAGGWWSGTPVLHLLAVSVLVVVYLLFWTALVLRVAAWRLGGPVVAALMVGVWAGLALLYPQGMQLAVATAVPVPHGPDIALAQREQVNGAWDLPKEATMQAFVGRHPQWAGQAEIERPFEWKWYFAFQRVGDIAVEEQSRLRREGILQRQQWLDGLALASPPWLAHRLLSRLAETDTRAALAYDGRIRQFHAALQDFYYPLLFSDREYDEAILAGLPEFGDIGGDIGGDGGGE